MTIKEQITGKPRVLVLGATGRIGSRVVAEL
jgi:nucleoside-diphosphate-sugar epimerase